MSIGFDYLKENEDNLTIADLIKFQREIENE